MTVHAGWHLLAFDSELGLGLSPCAIGGRRLMALRTGTGLRVFDATCPHRGAHLALGGIPAGDAVLCPFHGKRIGLGCGTSRWSVAEYETVQLGDAVFVRLSEDPEHDRGFRKAVADLTGRGRITEALATTIAAPPELIIENAFDTEHFPTVHRVTRVSGVQTRSGPSDELIVEGVFHSRTPTWESARGGAQADDFRNPFAARAFSPGLVVSEVGPPGRGHVVITGANPVPGGCRARVAVAAREGDEAALGALIAGSRLAFEQDRVIWENLDPDMTPGYDAADAAVVAFRSFCAAFPRG